MVGQEKLLKYIDTFSIDNFPKSSIILGEDGSGKHLICDYISKKLNLPIIEYSDISFESLLEIQLKAFPSIYLIDGTKLSEKQQNVILKFIEEPLKNSFIIILAENKNMLLNTVINRCRIFELEVYTKAQLELFVLDNDNKKLILEVCETPGQILNLEHVDIKSLYSLCEKIMTKLEMATYVNTLSISEKLNYSDEYDKFDVLLFFKVLNYVAGKYYIENNNEKFIKLYKIISEYRYKLNKDKRLNKEHLVDNFLTKLWLESRNG